MSSFKRLFGARDRGGFSFKRSHQPPTDSNASTSFKRSAEAVGRGVLAISGMASRWRVVGQEAHATNEETKGAGGSKATVGSEAHWEVLRSEDDRAFKSAKLRKACAAGNCNHARVLIQKGASTRDRDEAFERTPLHYASVRGHVDCVRLLVNHGALVDARDLSDQTALHMAAEHGWAGLISVLVRECGADMSARTSSGNAPLHYAANNNHEQACAVLMQLMAQQRMLPEVRRELPTDPRLVNYEAFRNNWGQTPVELAAQKGHRQLALMLSEPVPVGEMRTPMAMPSHSLPAPACAPSANAKPAGARRGKRAKRTK